MKKWEILNELRIKNNELRFGDLISLLLKNRGIKTKKQIDEFLNPKLESLTTENLGIDKLQLSKAIKRIKKAIEKKEMIVVFGDYDVDGITGTAILWESLNSLGANVMPYIPHRVEEGYGLSKIGIENLAKQYKDVSLIITVDNGIVANAAVDFANSLKIDVIITDHHVPSKKLPDASAIVHSTQICGAAVAYIFSRQFVILSKADNVILSETKDLEGNKILHSVQNDKLGAPQNDIVDEHLGLVALATVADVMKLTDFNRTLLIFGLQELRQTKRPGLLALFKLAEIEADAVGVYEIGHIIAPRINAMGRLEHAMDSLRLLCTKDKSRAQDLAQKLNSTNLERQRLTFDSFDHAKNLVGKTKKKLIFISSDSYEPGVIGLIAGRLSEEYYRPSIVVSIGETYSKASARSVSGFNIIEFIRLSSSLLVDAGGHPGAAGFTVETKKIKELQKLLENLSEKKIAKELLTRIVKIDCELSLDLINANLFDSINKLSPFGYGNPEPTFLAKKVLVTDVRRVGKEQNHLKLQFKPRSDLDRASNQGRTFNIMGGILFGYDQSLDLKIGDKVNVVYTISENIWNGNKKLELKIRDLR